NAEAMRVAFQQCLPGQAAPQTVHIPAISPNVTIVVPATNVASGLICPRCGYQNRPGAKFCKRDGQPLVQGATIAPPQIRTQAARSSIQPRPVQQPIPARSGGSIQARPVSTVADPNAAYRAGLQHLANKHYAEAIQQFQAARNTGGASYDVLYNLGRAHRQQGQSVKESNRKQFTDQMKAAAEYFDEAVRLKADALDAYFQLGMCYRDLKLYAQATSTFKKALGLAPQDPAIYYQLGLVAVEQGYMREAEAYFLDGLRINASHALILVALGRLYTETKQVPSAINVLRQATQSDPALWEGWYELGRAHMKAREWRLGLSALERARQVNQLAPETYGAMATCYLKMGKKVEARQMVNEALQRDPKNAEATRVQKQL
ncbi:MAG TPA: tetratricopeptide repeat protein, partial [Ktedonobacteraceae bacterium]|nr:tetratricopeptide repeat protein [Ktedonobacteraceae bacterium]